jgi:hypothetical protein
MTRADVKDQGESYLDQRDQKRLVHQHVARLEALGFQVALTPRPPEQAAAID